MKYEMNVTKLEHGFVTVEAGSEDEAKEKVDDMDTKGEILYFNSEFTDITVNSVV